MTYLAPDGRVRWNREEHDMGPVCDHCGFGKHEGCDQRGRNNIVCYCGCETATAARKMVRTPPGLDDLPDTLVQDAADLRYEAIEAAHVEYARGAGDVLVPREVLAALISRAKKWDGRGKGVNSVIKEGVAENGDPFYQRAKKALDEIGTFRRVEVDHETDILTTSTDRGVEAHYRSGVNEVTITITGYTR